MLKKIAFGFAGLLLILCAGIYFLVSNLDGYVRTAIEKYGSEATQATVQLDRVKLSLGSGQGRGELDGFSVGNPRGFSSAKSISVGQVALQLDTSTLGGPGPIVINRVVVDKPQVAYELDNDGNSNLQTIQKNTQSYASAVTSGGGDQSPANPPTPGTPKQPARKLIIKDLVISNGNVSISQASLKDRKLATSLPSIHLTNVGQSSGGATAAEIAEQVLGKISNEAAQAAIGELAKQKINGVLKEVPAGAIGGAAVDNVGSQIKGLFK